MKYKRYALIAAFLLGACPLSAQSFEAFRLKSGMTPEQVAGAYPSYQLQWLIEWPPGSRSAIFTDRERRDVFSLKFCNNSLVGLTHSIDPDTDLFRYIEERLSQFGQPKVSVKRDSTANPKKPRDMVELTWIHNDVSDTVSFSSQPVWLGEDRHLHMASVALLKLTGSCMAPSKP